MKLHVDLETLQLIEGPGFRNPVGSLRFKRGDAAKLEVVFLRNGSTPEAIGDPATLELQFGVKPRGRYDVGYLVHQPVWTMPEPEAVSPLYSCTPSFNTVELDSAMQVGSSTGTELAEIALMGEITWREGAGEPSSTRTFTVIVENDVNRGTEGVPVDAAPAYPLPDALELVARKGVAGGYAALDAGGKVPAAQLPSTPEAVLHRPVASNVAYGYYDEFDLGHAAATHDIVQLRFHVYLPGYSGDRIGFQLLDASWLAILNQEIICEILGVDGYAWPYWLYDIWIEGAFDASRPTKIWINAQQCPTGSGGGYGSYWTGSGSGTVDEFGQINVAAMSGGGSYGYGGTAGDSSARYLRIRNIAANSHATLDYEGVLTRIPTRL